jgi:uncharacterized protein YegP (UPF0339 family)
MELIDMTAGKTENAAKAKLGGSAAAARPRDEPAQSAAHRNLAGRQGADLVDGNGSRPPAWSRRSAGEGEKWFTAGNGRPRRSAGNKSRESRMTFVVYEDNSRRWGWRLVTSRGSVLADSGQRYRREENAVDAVHRIQDSAAAAGLSAQ